MPLLIKFLWELAKIHNRQSSRKSNVVECIFPCYHTSPQLLFSIFAGWGYYDTNIPVLGREQAIEGFWRLVYYANKRETL